MKQYVGLAFQELAPSVGAKILQDCIAMLTITDAYHKDLVICSDTEVDKLTYLLSSLNLTVTNEVTKPTLFITYRTKEECVDVPDQCQTVVERSFYSRDKSNNLLFDVDESGHVLKDDYKVSFSNLNRIWNHPNGFTPPDAAMIMMWGPVKA